MIVYSTEHHFVMVKQYDHSRLAGELAKLLHMNVIGDRTRLEDFQLAVMEHDRGWIDLDEVPLWNDIRHKPYGVEDLPLLLRLPFYHRGLQEIGELSEYAALLVGLHYTSFQSGALAYMVGGFHERAMPHMERLKQEQLQMTKKLGLLNHDGAQLLEHHLNLLQLCDELSLYLCAQDPGTSKNKELLPYKEGFHLKSSFLDGSALVPEWISPDQLQLTPFPLQKQQTLSYPAKIIAKTRIHEIGLVPAYTETAATVRTFTIC